MIQVIHNSAGSGDWVVVKMGNRVLFEGHKITPNDLTDIFNQIIPGVSVKMNVTDEQMEEGNFDEILAKAQLR